LSLTFADREGARFGAPVVSAVVGVGLER
jgi:hypothetical protein